VDNHSSNEEVLAAAALLGVGQRMIGVCLEGTITAVNTPYNSRYGNVTVTMNVNGQSIRCNRLGDNKDVAKLGKGDYIKVYGKLWKNASGALEYQNDCGLVSATIYEKLEQPAAGAKITIAQALALGTTDNKVRVTGTITEIVSQTWGNMYIKDSTGTLYIYGAYDEAGRRFDAMPTKPQVGETYTFYGKIKTYNTTVEMENATVEGLPSGGGEGGGTEVGPNSPLKDQLEDAVNKGTYTGYTSTIQGAITSEPEYRSNYDNYSFNVTDSATGLTVYCYGLGGSGYTPKKGDVVKVAGQLTAYNGKAQFDYKSTLTVISQAGGSEPEIPEVDASSSLKELVAAVKAGAVLDFEITVTGTVKAAYDNGDGTKNIPIITTEGQINCNFVKDNGTDGWDNVAADDTVVMRGKLILKNGKVRIDNAVLVSVTHKACEHANKVDDITLEATCGAAGLKNIVCDDCGEVIEKDVEIPATGEHAYTEGTCGVCGGTDPNYVPPEGGEVTPPEGGEGGEVTPPEGGEGGEVTPPEGGEGGEVTPPEGGEGGEVTPPEGGEENT